MSLPFLKPKSAAGLIISHRKPDGGTEQMHDGEDDNGLHAAAEDMIRAFHSKDAKALAEAVRAAFQILDAEPHEEGEHTNDYDSQNKLAAQESR